MISEEKACSILILKFLIRVLYHQKIKLINQKDSGQIENCLLYFQLKYQYLYKFNLLHFESQLTNSYNYLLTQRNIQKKTMSEDNSIEKRCVLIDRTDLQCPVTLESYTEQNYPVTLPCSHTLSIEAFNQIKKNTRLTQSPLCPQCRKAFSRDYAPPKNRVLTDISLQKSVQLTRSKLMCQKHPNEPIGVICLDEKVFLCLECVVQDKHHDHQMISLKNLHSYIQEKRKILVEAQENLFKNTIRDEQVKQITQAIIATKIEPLLQEIVRIGLQNHIMDLGDIGEPVKKIDELIENISVRKSIDVIKEMEIEINKLEKMTPKNSFKETVEKITRKVMGLFQAVSLRPESDQRQSKSIEIQIQADLSNISGLEGKETYTDLKVKFDRDFQALYSFCSELKSFNTLSSLQLDFWDCRYIDTSALVTLNTNLQSMTLLTSFHLNFGGTTIGDLGVELLGSALKNMTRLSEVRLDFTCCRSISNKGLRELSIALKSHSLSLTLTNLQLIFNHCGSISDVGLQDLSLALENLNLKTLQLNFWNCKLISDKGIKELSSALKRNTSLESLCLDFTWCELISDSGMKDLGFVLRQKNKMLANIELLFNNCNLLTDAGVKELSESLEGMISLSNLRLEFLNCQRISEEGREKLVYILKNYKMNIQKYINSYCYTPVKKWIEAFKF